MDMILLGIDTDQKCTMLVQKKKEVCVQKQVVLKKMQLSSSVLHNMEKSITFRNMVFSNWKLYAE